MSEVSRMTREQIDRLLAVFTAVQWPVASSEAESLVRDIGWTVRSARELSVDVTTDVPVNSPLAAFSFHDGSISRVAVDASDRFRDPDAAQQQDFATAVRSLTEDVTAVLGEPVRRRAGKNALVTWDLTNGGRVVVERLNRVVQVVVLSRRYADLERREEGLGISDDRDPHDPANDLA